MLIVYRRMRKPHKKAPKRERKKKIITKTYNF
jgi:hypothetical protein